MDVAHGVAVDRLGDVVVVGYFEGEATFGALGKRTSHGASDAFVVMLDPTGKPKWVQTFGGAREDTANAVAISGDTIVVVGNFLDQLDVGTFHQPAAGADDMFAVAFDLGGEPQWMSTSGGVASDGANAVAATPTAAG